jgi:hypothetical protein
MKSKTIFLSTLLLTIVLFSFKNNNEIGKCYLSFTPTKNLKVTVPDRLPVSSERGRLVNTENGEVKVSRIDGYRLFYNNDKNVPFVNLKVELSEENAYETDKIKIIDHLKYMNSRSKGMETKELIELNFNGYKIWGLSRENIETASTLGIFAMFPENGITVYFYFNNQKLEDRNFENLEDYKKQRDQFIDEYTKHLATCK